MARHPDPDEGATAWLDEAVAWRVRLTEQGLDTSPEFESWRAADPLRASAWRKVEGLWTLFGDQAASPELLAIRRDALDRARGEGEMRGTRRPTPSRRLVAAVAILMLAIGIGISVMPRPRIYETALGERRSVALADGSRLTLDAGSRVRVRFRSKAREVDLVRGQARFDVAHDATRPFRVHARDQVVVAVGTSFNVDLLGPTVTVTLMQGRVTISGPRAGRLIGAGRGPGPETITTLEAGERLVVEATRLPATPHIEAISADRASAWESGKLVFENEPLGAVAERVSRYTPRRLRVEDPEVADLRISGVFDAGDIETFLDTVTRYLPVETRPAEGGGLLLERRSAPNP